MKLRVCAKSLFAFELGIDIIEVLLPEKERPDPGMI